ncbi:MAG: hypothetical protein QXK18_05800 [Candidatus Bathyarchaeia archaeon]
MSMSKREFFKPIISGAIAALLLGAITYYLIPIPRSPSFAVIAFALGSSKQFSGNYFTLFVDSLNITFSHSNGSTIQIHPPWQSDNYTINLNFPKEYAGELNLTDLEKITVSITTLLYMNDESTLKFIVGVIENRTIDVNLHVDERTINLGYSKVSGKSFGFVSGTGTEEIRKEVHKILSNLTDNINERISTGYWNVTDYIWEISIEELKDMLSGSNLANITFTMEKDMFLKYYVVTPEGSIYGESNLQWSGIWGTFQLILWEDETTTIRYDISNIELNMIVA